MGKPTVSGSVSDAKKNCQVAAIYIAGYRLKYANRVPNLNTFRRFVKDTNPGLTCCWCKHLSFSNRLLIYHIREKHELVVFEKYTEHLRKAGTEVLYQ